jgi:hypothetical protein
VQIDSPKKLKVSTEKQKKFKKNFETVEALCHVMLLTGFQRPKTGKDDDDDDEAGKEDVVAHLKDSVPRQFSVIKLIPTTEVVIKRIIHFMKLRNPSSYDEITAEILKACSYEINLS